MLNRQTHKESMKGFIAPVRSWSVVGSFRPEYAYSLGCLTTLPTQAKQIDNGGAPV